jgi:hypothetical protein
MRRMRRVRNNKKNMAKNAAPLLWILQLVRFQIFPYTRHSLVWII